MDREAWQGYHPWGQKESDMIEQLSECAHIHTQMINSKRKTQYKLTATFS